MRLVEISEAPRAPKTTDCDTSDEIKRAKEVMKRTGAEDISSTGESSADSTKPDEQVRRTAM